MLTPVQRAESDAHSLVVSAEGLAKNELARARKRALEMVKARESTAREEVQQMVASSVELGEDEAADILARSRKGIEAMGNKATERTGDACRVIVERITGTG
ncbi:hypothetical protein KAU45_05495 [bacterium]|nr:hypothetical protein [bacterium]